LTAAQREFHHRIDVAARTGPVRERDDIEIVEFPNMISADDFEVMLKEHAPVHGVALGATCPYRKPNLAGK
jgi:hypothetical protein